MKNGRRKQMLTRLKHIKTTKKLLSDGSQVTYYYHRLTGKRIHGEPATPEFIENYTLASQSDKGIQVGTLSALIEDYKNSQAFANLSAKTVKDYDTYLYKIQQQFGTMSLKVLEDPRIRKDLLKWRDEIGKTSLRQADYAWSVFRRVVQFGVHNGEINQNHLSRPGRLYKADRTDKIWLPDDVGRFLKIANNELRNSLILALHTGQRKGDLIKLSWTHYDGSTLTLRQSKTKRKVCIPVTSTLKNVLDSMPRIATTILTNTRGLPWTADGFGTSWGKCAKKAGIIDLTFHDLRGTAVTILAEQGSSHLEIASITGHSLKYVECILDTYASRTKTLAKAAIFRLEQSWINDVGKDLIRTKNKQK